MIIWVVWATDWEDALLPAGINFAAFTKEECEDWIRQILPDLEKTNSAQWQDLSRDSRCYCIVEAYSPINGKYHEAMALLFGRL